MSRHYQYKHRKSTSPIRPIQSTSHHLSKQNNNLININTYPQAHIQNHSFQQFQASLINILTLTTIHKPITHSLFINSKDKLLSINLLKQNQNKKQSNSQKLIDRINKYLKLLFEVEFKIPNSLSIESKFKEIFKSIYQNARTQQQIPINNSRNQNCLNNNHPNQYLNKFLKKNHTSLSTLDLMRYLTNHLNQHSIQKYLKLSLYSPKNHSRNNHQSQLQQKVKLKTSRYVIGHKHNHSAKHQQSYQISLIGRSIIKQNDLKQKLNLSNHEIYQIIRKYDAIAQRMNINYYFLVNFYSLFFILQLNQQLFITKMSTQSQISFDWKDTIERVVSLDQKDKLGKVKNVLNTNYNLENIKRNISKYKIVKPIIQRNPKKQQLQIVQEVQNNLEEEIQYQTKPIIKFIHQSQTNINIKQNRQNINRFYNTIKIIPQQVQTYNNTNYNSFNQIHTDTTYHQNDSQISKSLITKNKFNNLAKTQYIKITLNNKQRSKSTNRSTSRKKGIKLYTQSASKERKIKTERNSSKPIILKRQQQDIKKKIKIKLNKFQNKSLQKSPQIKKPQVFKIFITYQIAK